MSLGNISKKADRLRRRAFEDDDQALSDTKRRICAVHGSERQAKRRNIRHNKLSHIFAHAQEHIVYKRAAHANRVD